MIRAIFTEGIHKQTTMFFRKYLSMKARTIQEPVNLFTFQTNGPVFVRYKSLSKSISQHISQSVHKYISVKTVS